MMFGRTHGRKMLQNIIFRRKISAKGGSEGVKGAHRADSGKGTARGPVTWLSLGLVALTGVGLSLFYEIEKERKIVKPASVSNVKSVGTPAIGGPWVLVNQDGESVTDASFRGQFCLLYFPDPRRCLVVLRVHLLC